MADFHADCARIFNDWHACAKAGDAEGLLALYAPDAALESPLVPVVLPGESPVLHGHDAIRRFLHAGARRLTRRLTHWHRAPTWLTDGARLLVWEYPRETPDGEQLDIAEVMEVAGGLIRRHRIYWGCFGTARLAERADWVAD